MIVLSDEERRRFVLYLRQDADSNAGIVKQLETLPHAKLVVDAKKREIAACLIVANMLDSGEVQMIRG